MKNAGKMIGYGKGEEETLRTKPTGIGESFIRILGEYPSSPLFKIKEIYNMQSTPTRAINTNRFIWEFNGKREESNGLVPSASIQVLPLKKDWWSSIKANSNMDIKDLLNRYFDLDIADVTSLQVFFRNNENSSGDFSAPQDVILSGKQLCHYFFPDSIYIILKNHSLIEGKEVFCNDFLLKEGNQKMFFWIKKIKYMFEGEDVLPGQSRIFFVFFESKFNFDDIVKVYWKYANNIYPLGRKELRLREDIWQKGK